MKFQVGDEAAGRVEGERYPVLAVFEHDGLEYLVLGGYRATLHLAEAWEVARPVFEVGKKYRKPGMSTVYTVIHLLRPGWAVATYDDNCDSAVLYTRQSFVEVT